MTIIKTDTGLEIHRDGMVITDATATDDGTWWVAVHELDTGDRYMSRASAADLDALEIDR